MLRKAGKKLIFVTNNSTKSRKGYQGKFTNLGLTIAPEEIYSSSFAAAAYLDATNFPKDKKVYVVGEVGIQEELDLLGFQHIGGPEDTTKVTQTSSRVNAARAPGQAAPYPAYDHLQHHAKL